MSRRLLLLALAAGLLAGCRAKTDARPLAEAELRAHHCTPVAGAGSDAVLSFRCENGFSGSLDLSNLQQELAHAGPEEAQRQVAAAVSNVIGAQDHLAASTLPRDDLLLTLKPRAAVEQTLARIPPELRATHGIPAKPLVGDLVSIFVIDRPNTVQVVTADRIAQWATPPAELEALALKNLKRHCPAPEVTAAAGAKLARTVVDDYSAGCILVEDYRQAVRAALGGGVVFAVPNRDVVLAARADDAPSMAKLRQVAAEEAQKPYALSADLIQQRADGSWFVVQP